MFSINITYLTGSHDYHLVTACYILKTTNQNKIGKRGDHFGTKLFSGLKYKRPFNMDHKNGNLMHEVCIPHRANRAWEQQGLNKREEQTQES